MSELAFNINGEAFDLPATATGWRVRRMRQGRGAPEVVYGKEGVPLIVPIEAGLEELRQIVGAPGRYRLDAIDDRGKTVDDLPASYVIVPTRELDVQAAAHDTRNLDGGMASVLGEAMRLNTELAKAVIDRFPEMMTAAAELLRAADGAGLPSRAPRVVEESDDDDDDDDTQTPTGSPGFELINNLVAQVIPIVVTSLAGKKMPKLASVLDWRKASAEGQQAKQAAAPALDVTTATEAATEDDESLPPLDPKTMSHFITIQSTLTPTEAALARQVAAELSPVELRAWFNELSALSVPDAVAKIRSMLGATSKAGGAS
jgi:hypothetical protein